MKRIIAPLVTAFAVCAGQFAGWAEKTNAAPSGVAIDPSAPASWTADSLAKQVRRNNTAIAKLESEIEALCANNEDVSAQTAEKARLEAKGTELQKQLTEYRIRTLQKQGVSELRRKLDTMNRGTDHHKYTRAEIVEALRRKGAKP